MKKTVVRIAVMLIALMMACPAAMAAEIAVGKRDLGINESLDKNVSNILILLQDEGRTDTLMIASINSRTGRSVMTRIDCALTVHVPEVGDVALSDVYELGNRKSKGFLAARTLNQLLGLNINTYVALDITRLPELAAAVGTLNMQFDAEEAAALGTWEGINELTGDAVLAYVRLKLESDEPTRSRGYDALMQLLYQGLHSGDLMGMMGLGKKLLGSMDTNLNPMAAVTMVSAVQSGTDRREVFLPMEEHILTNEPLTADAQAMTGLLHKEIYE